MAIDEEHLSEESGENTMLREAMEALRLGDRGRACDLLVRLLKTDQKNPTYWLWLSAAVDTQTVNYDAFDFDSQHYPHLP